MLYWQEKGLLLDNTSLTVSELVVLLSRKCAFGSTCSINRNEEGRKEGRKEERNKVAVSLKKLSCIVCIYFPNQGESCPADMGLLYGRAPPVSVQTSQVPHGYSQPVFRGSPYLLLAHHCSPQQQQGVASWPHS